MTIIPSSRFGRREYPVDERADPNSPLYLGPGYRTVDHGAATTVERPGLLRRAYETASNAASGFLFGVKSDFDRGGRPYVSDPGALGVAMFGGPPLKAVKSGAAWFPGFRTAARTEKAGRLVEAYRGRAAKAAEMVADHTVGKPGVPLPENADRIAALAEAAAVKASRAATGHNARLRALQGFAAEKAAARALKDARPEAVVRNTVNSVEVPSSGMFDWLKNLAVGHKKTAIALATTAGAWGAYKVADAIHNGNMRAANEKTEKEKAENEHTKWTDRLNVQAELASRMSDTTVAKDTVRDILMGVEADYRRRADGDPTYQMLKTRRGLSREDAEKFAAAQYSIMSNTVAGSGWPETLAKVLDSDAGRELVRARTDLLVDDALLKTRAAPESPEVRKSVMGANMSANPISVLTGVDFGDSFRSIGDYLVNTYGSQFPEGKGDYRARWERNMDPAAQQNQEE